MKGGQRDCNRQGGSSSPVMGRLKRFIQSLNSVASMLLGRKYRENKSRSTEKQAIHLYQALYIFPINKHKKKTKEWKTEQRCVKFAGMVILFQLHQLRPSSGNSVCKYVVHPYMASDYSIKLCGLNSLGVVGSTECCFWALGILSRSKQTAEQWLAGQGIQSSIYLLNCTSYS